MKDLAPRGPQQPVRPDRIESDDFYRPSEPEQVHVREYLKVFLKRRRLAAIVFLAVFIPGAYCVFTGTRLYIATATVKIEPQIPTVTGVAEMLRLEGSKEYYQTQIVLLKSRTLADKVINELQLESKPAFTEARVVD